MAPTVGSMLASLVPPHQGLLPYFLLYGAVAAVVHTVVSYFGAPRLALRQFSGPKRPPPSKLLAHVYGVKNIYTGLIRAYAAYHITNPQLYDLALFSLVGVLFLYITEMIIWKTVRLREAMFPYIIAGTGTYWMLTQHDFYVS